MTSYRSVLLPATAGVAVAFLITVTSLPPASFPVWAEDPAKGNTTDKLPPLTIDKEAPLLLDEAHKDAPVESAAVSINHACFVCHGNLKEEPLVMAHAEAEVSCMECHGASLEHRNDEDNVTPPDIMYSAEKIDAACHECHDTHDAAAKQVLARWQERCPQKSDFTTVVCTDCHGRHRLSKRLVRWDKKTRELILRDVNPAATKETNR